MADTNKLLSENIFFLTSALSRALISESDEKFATEGLSSSHTLLLLLVYKNPGIQPGLLAEKMYLSPSTVTRLVQKLERRSLLEKNSDGRAAKIVCTSEGEVFANSIEEKWEKLVLGKKEQLGERYVEVLTEMVSKALDTMEGSGED